MHALKSMLKIFFQKKFLVWIKRRPPHSSAVPPPHSSAVLLADHEPVSIL